MKYTQSAKNVLDEAKRFSKKLHYNYTGTEHILAGLVKEDEGVASEVLALNDVDLDKLLSLMNELLSVGEGTMLAERDGFTPSAQRVIDQAAEQAVRFHSQEIGTEHLLLAIVKEGDCAACRLLNTMNVSLQKLFADLLTSMGENPIKYRSEMQFARQGTGSSTPLLDQFSRDLTEMAKEGRLDPVIGRKSETERVIQILCRRTKNNPCLIGEPGVGKTAIVEGIAEKIVDGNVPEIMRGKRLVALDMTGMVANSKYRGEFEERIKRVMNEVIASKDVILFIDELHTIIGAGGAEGAMDASNILKPALSRGEMQVIGATTMEEYRKYVEKDAALERRFQPVQVEQPGEEESIQILKGLRPLYEEHHNVVITDEGIEAAVRLSSRYISDRFLPDKAIDLMDEAAARARLSASTGASTEGAEQIRRELTHIEEELEDALIEKDWDKAKACREQRIETEARLKKEIKKNSRKSKKKTPHIGEDEIADVVAGWTKIPVSRLTEKEAVRLQKLEETLHKRVIGQEEAVCAVSRAVRRGRTGLKDPKRPIGSFLFL
ncbi:MAG: ATP-dependent Clp protease ATP-binding subunit [Clostridiales bacterium]|nr:ATP-dependent Clp protease ATP-binding subunit [Clostridiales bacterium]